MVSVVTAGVLQQLVHDLALELMLGVGRVLDAGIDQRTVEQDAARVRERLEAPAPWYLPIPELPTPPKGNSGTSGWMAQSLTQASPEFVASKICSVTLSSAVNT
jgi:hypothetical protein